MLESLLLLSMLENYFYSDNPSAFSFEAGGAAQQGSARGRCNSILVFIVLGFFFLIFALVELVTNYQEVKYVFPLRAGQMSMGSDSQLVAFGADRAVAVYLGLRNVTQYDHQNLFEGQFIEDFTPQADSCDHYRYNGQIDKTVSALGGPLSAEALAMPCGRYASLFPQTVLTITFNENTVLPIKGDDLSFFSYKATNADLAKQWIDLTNPLFQNWMEQNADVSTTKLLGTISGGFQGQLKFDLSLTANSQNMRENAEIIVTDNRAMGGHNTALCSASFVQSALMFLFALVVYLYRKISRQKEESESQSSHHQIELRSQSDSVNDSKL